MQKYRLNELREMYLSFFEKKNHLRMSSFSLVPQNDPSILLINAGMTPLKPYFTGILKPPHLRVTTCQKCVRTTDIENAGITARHGTFFEMLGNFSFGEYFKKEAISWAWEFFTQVLKIPEEKLYITIYYEDNEAYEIWNKDIGISNDKIIRLGKEDNFWEHGTGPCGPCSEIHYDRGQKYGCNNPDCKPGCDCDRYMEIWNLVFTQFDKKENGSYEMLDSKNIDTGMGLERLACIMQEAENMFEVDSIKNILMHICSVSEKKYGEKNKDDVSIRIITDHIRGSVHMISDGIIPSNEGRGYVLRRLIRRAARHGKLLGITDKFLSKVAITVIEESKAAYPELIEKYDYILKVIDIEEKKFIETIEQGMSILEEYITKVNTNKEKIISGDMAFKLHDTYGFPFDLTKEIAIENKLEIDEDGFRVEMQKQKNMARKAFKKNEGSAWDKDIFAGVDKDSKTEFTGYDEYETTGTIEYIIIDDKFENNVVEGKEAYIVLDKTPFYAVSGGQDSDIGIIESIGTVFEVNTVTKTPEGKFLHNGVIKKGELKKGQKVIAKINTEKRIACAKNHTATHILQKALEIVLGSHIAQAGSHVTSNRLRFDFTHFSPVSNEQLKEVEQICNNIIFSDFKVGTEEMSIKDAEKTGAKALFSEKYQGYVRVVSIGDFSKELCGGTHIKTTAQVGIMKILSETGIAAGVRRIEATTGRDALSYYIEKEQVLNETANILKASSDDITKKAFTITEQLKNMKKEIEELKNKMASGSTNSVLENAKEINGIKVVTGRFDLMDINGLRNTCDRLREKLSSGVVALASSKDGKVSFVIGATKDVVEKGIHCGNIIRKAATIAGGRGGGRPDMAQAGGNDTSKIDEALNSVYDTIKEGMI